MTSEFDFLLFIALLVVFTFHFHVYPWPCLRTSLFKVLEIEQLLTRLCYC